MPIKEGKLQSLRRGATRALALRTKQLSKFFKFSKGVLYAGMAALAGAMQFVAAGGNVAWPGWIGIGATAIIFCYAIASIRMEPDATRQLGVAHEAIEEALKAQLEAERISDSIRHYQRMFDRIIELFQATRTMRGLIQSATVPGGIQETDLIPTMLETVGRSISIAAGFALDDEWTICIYKAVPEVGDCRKILKLVAHHRAIQCDIKEARDWEEGQGVAGVSFRKREEVIVDNLADDSIRSLTTLKKDGSRPTQGRYASIVSVPIFTAGVDEPWGVVCGTNDEPDHFNHGRQSQLKPEEAIRTLASYVGLAISVVRCREAIPDRPGALGDQAAGGSVELG